ncbi:hypothetical protein ACSCB1_28500 [Streptomyces europaeiscabiei]|uniref:hypothetical protein n=1 Tax=Streptomyces europaeiscabiei TaxID=146819 RepID=UPI00069C6024|nr:hypothetical protein [Streptomyces europaeiscabiei]
MTTLQNQVAEEATIAEQARTAALGAVAEEIVDCFERREPWAILREMTEAMLVELDTRNCWTLAEDSATAVRIGCSTSCRARSSITTGPVTGSLPGRPLNSPTRTRC